MCTKFCALTMPRELSRMKRRMERYTQRNVETRLAFRRMRSCGPPANACIYFCSYDLFCFHDLDPDPMTLIHKRDLDIPKMHPHTTNSF